ncbi:bifunctional diaminohydroxyphosphoribosylaminopyrimidine deaminase/5-amino-6-(5-phosphoribosylamino)uracil reductase RibD [Hathewaya histolytica]|uniref:Riboflavin biosynthesis protein RibD n=1 Tax=Hathewaya histolytica TaxID=1498 RepID=A0A4U9RU41_HATHI|nr:bifunctional diaminohydroxyphosphoribosylaminopyrimidine deaminase/5-amino-6-(5-phosphoribosylamino)uracil reductase RibD [Hathewaya histolytica]VTQ95942.1 riboflavin biosynthesis protein RibD [Hathewaya histolytica]
MDEYYMKIALDLANKGRGKVNPNPMVGAIIVKDNRIIASGYHKEYGKAHAEVDAINNAIDDVTGATMYVNLEPCFHYGKTGPCVDKIIEKKISRVVIGMVDPNPMVSGKGITKLKEAGIEVVVGVLEKESIKLNEVFIKYITHKKPFVILKTATSLDSKIATISGESKWITGEESRIDVHKLRGEVSGIMVGIDTIIKDNPQLTCRVKDTINPIRIIVDSHLRIPMESKVLQGINKAKTIIATTEKADKCKLSTLTNLGVKVLIVKSKYERVDLQDLMIKLGELRIDSILLEGGSTLNFSALDECIVDKIQIYIAPKIIGGEKAKTSIGGRGITLLKDAYKVKNLTSSFTGEDILLEGYIEGGRV